MTEYPERGLWQQVLLTALQDACNPTPTSKLQRMEKDDAHKWFERGGKRFERICELAGFAPEFIRDAYLSGRIKPTNLYQWNKLCRLKPHSPLSGDCDPAQPGIPVAGRPVPSAVNKPPGSDRPGGVETRA